MGLVLHSSPADPIFSQRHFPPESPRARRYHGRDRAGLIRAVLARPVTGDALSATKADLLRRRTGSSTPSIPRRRAPRHGPFVTDTDDDSIRLARSTVALPSDGSRDRVPSLERQDAFRDPSTTRPAPLRSLSQGCEDEDPEVAELYRLGLLYDDEHLRGAGFGLNAIIRDEPSYTVTLAVRSPRRHRKGSHRDPAAPAKLPMDWTFTGLVEDDDVARYLVSDKSSTDPEPRRGYRMVWRAAPAADSAPDGPSSETASFYSLQRSAHSDSHGPDRGDDFDIDDMGWAVLSRARDDDDDAVLATEDAATGAWLVLGDGS
ncbi:hypothetical protein B0T11DRAFT_1581 [Plectosphaerella cucumerina]|uniref:Uncharacterized protein n=1 Tax=Plectosphaerella cucumerina TaxID=40658 RepID=A0A8K0TQ38_9PEZI|nr:hypothetical protein B0T11DRAFT_1581 [Plectosphaerella cucumerina]